MAADGTRHLSPLTLCLWSVVIGLVGAVGAWVFRALIALFHNLFFLGEFSWGYDANVHTPPGPWGPLVILVPVVGAAGVALLVKYFAPEAKGHGVPEVMDAIYYNKGVIRPIVAVVKSLASALSIGTGGSVGREGPIVQIGSTFGSTLGQFLAMPIWQRVTLIAAGAGAGIAATFNTPIGGVLFAMEIMLHEVSARTLVPVTIATVTASYVGRLLFGSHPSFVIPNAGQLVDVTDFSVLLLYLGLGVLMGLVSLAYIRSIYAFEDFFEERIKLNVVLRHMLGMFVVGCLMYVLLLTTGHYHIEGVGYATIQDILEGEASWLLLVLFALKLLATSLTLGSGASGGVFSPALFMGATLGGAYGLMMHVIFPGLPIRSSAFAMAGMAGVVSGSTGAALTAIVMIFEMTRDYSVIIPMTITVALSYGVRKTLHAASIYTEKLVRRGHEIPDALQANFYLLTKTRDIMDTNIVSVPAAGTMADLAREAAAHPDVWYFVVVGPAGIVGVLTRAALRPAEPSEPPATLEELADRRFVTVDDHFLLMEVMARLRLAGANIALVMTVAGNGVVRGLITQQQIAAAVLAGMELFSE